MLNTENADFKVNRDGTMDIYPKTGFTLATMPLVEVAEMIRMATKYARSKKIKKPMQYREIVH